MNEQASAWLNAVDGLPSIHQRLKRVVVLNRDAVDVIRSQDGPQTFFYLDAPYVASTRTVAEVYEHEMTLQQHEELLRTIKKCEGKVMMSGYANDLYDGLLCGWHRHQFDLPNNSASGDTKRRVTEVLWCNFRTHAERQRAAA